MFDTPEGSWILLPSMSSPLTKRHVTKSRTAQAVVPLVLIVVALVHMLLVHAGSMSPWVGGGFGMFASVDRREHRVVRAVANVDGAQVPLDLEEFSENSGGKWRLIKRTRAMPTEGALRALAAELQSEKWTHDGRPWSKRIASERTIDIDELQLRVHRLRYESDGRRAKPELIAGIRVPS